MFALREYQTDMIERTRQALGRHKSVLIQLEPGGGKTAMGAAMTTAAVARGRTVWFAVHRDFLIRQTLATFDKVGIAAGVIAAKYQPEPRRRVQVVSLQTLARRYKKLTPPDFLIADESHHIPAKSNAAIAEWHLAAGGYMVGLTGTPARLDGRGLDRWFGEMITGPSYRELKDAGHLSGYRAFAPSRPDVSGVHTRAGDYARDELENVMDDRQIIGDLVGHWKKLANGLRTIYYAVSVRHSQHIAAAFNAAGVPALHLDSTSSSAERQQAANDLARGRVKVLTQVELFGEGYDLSSQAGCDVTIEAVGLARPTQSLTLHRQQSLRPLRPKPEPGIILDHAGNLARHGLPDTEIEWSLSGVDRKRGAAGTIPTRQCPSCFGVHRPAGSCPYCGHVYRIEGRELEEIEGVLAEIDIERARKAERIEQGRADTLEALIAIGQRRGYRNPAAWAGHVWKARQRRVG